MLLFVLLASVSPLQLLGGVLYCSVRTLQRNTSDFTGTELIQNGNSSTFCINYTARHHHTAFFANQLQQIIRLQTFRVIRCHLKAFLQKFWIAVAKQVQKAHCNPFQIINVIFDCSGISQTFSNLLIIKFWPQNTWHIQKFDAAFQTNPLFSTGNAWSVLYLYPLASCKTVNQGGFSNVWNTYDHHADRTAFHSLCFSFCQKVRQGIPYCWDQFL